MEIDVDGAGELTVIDYYSDSLLALEPGEGNPTCCPTGKVDIRYECGACGPVFVSAGEK